MTKRALRRMHANDCIDYKSRQALFFVIYSSKQEKCMAKVPTLEQVSLKRVLANRHIIKWLVADGVQMMTEFLKRVEQMLYPSAREIR